MTTLKRTILFTSLAVFSAITLLTAWNHQNKSRYPSSEAASKWLPIVNAWERNPNVKAYYSFQDEFASQGRIRNHAFLFPTNKRDLNFFDPPIPCRVVEGRWPGKQAIELDQGSIRLPVEDVSSETFTVAFWIRQAGLGSITGENFSQAASIMAAHNGIWFGWRIDLLFPSNRIVFQIAKKRGEPSVGVVSAIRVPPKTWTHVAVTRQPNRICIYVNGILAGETPHDVQALPIPTGSNMKIGYIGNGFSSAIVQLDDLLILSSAPPPIFFLSLAQNEKQDLIPCEQEWVESSQNFVSRDYQKSFAVLNKAKSQLPENTKIQSWVEFMMGETQIKMGETDNGMNTLLDVILNPNAEVNIRLLALHEYLVTVEGVNRESDPEPFTYQSIRNFEPNYSELSTASYRYENAAANYDYYIPLNEAKIQAIQ